MCWSRCILLLIAALLPLDITCVKQESVPKHSQLRKEDGGAAEEWSNNIVMNPLVEHAPRQKDGDRDFVMCTVNQPSNDWDMIREYIPEDTPLVLAVQDYNPKRDGEIMETEGIHVIESIPFHGQVVSSHLMTRGTVAVMASSSFLEMYTSTDTHIMLGDNTPTTVKGTVRVSFNPIEETGAPIMIISTHGSEGVRFKERSSHAKCIKLDGNTPKVPRQAPSCHDGTPDGISSEYCRVEHYRNAVKSLGVTGATLWGTFCFLQST